MSDRRIPKGETPKLVEEAIAALGSNATNQDLADWIKTHRGYEIALTAVSRNKPKQDEPTPAQLKRVEVHLASVITTLDLIDEMGIDKVRRAVKFWQSSHSTDSLTGLLNRRAILEVLEQELQRRLTSPNSLTIIPIDVKNFKKINDEYGHFCGDEVLRQLGFLLARTVQPGKYVGRYGGDEFLIIAPETNSQQSEFLRDQIRSAVEGASFSESEIKTSVSLGMAVAEVGANPTLEEMLQIAEESLEVDIRTGR